MSAQINFQELCKLIDSYKGRRVAITFHTIGDRDSVSSAIALAEYLPKATVVTPDFITRSAERMLEELNFSYIIERNLRTPEVIIIVDANNLESVGNLKPKIEDSDAEVLFIDHHAIPEAIYKNATIFNDEDFNSTASIVYEFMKNRKFTPSIKAAKLLLYGIAADSADFKNANALTFSQVSELLKSTNSNYSEVIYELSNRPPAKIRKKTIGEIFKSTVEQYGNYIVIYGQTDMHANESAELALGLGADVAVFWSVRKAEVSISARMYPDLDRKLSLHLGKVMQSIAPVIEGSGGGHPCAAGAYGPGINGAQEAVSKILSQIKNRMTK